MKESSPLSRPAVAAALALIPCFLWGSAVPCIKIGCQLFQLASSDIPGQLVFAGIRFSIAGLMVIAFASIRAHRLAAPSKATLPMVLKLGCVQTILQYVFYYTGVANTSGVNAAIITATNTFFCILLATLVFRYEALTAQKLIGCAVGFAGVALINLSSSSGGQSSLLGDGLVLIAAIAYAFSSVLVKRYSQKEDTFVLCGWQFLFGGVVMTLLGLVLGGRLAAPTAGSAALLVYMGFISAVAYSLWSVLLAHNPVARISVFGFMNPVFGVLLSALLLGEGAAAFRPQGLAALALICAGILVVNKAADKKD